MGRKGVSKRKTRQPKANPTTTNKVSGGVPSIVQAAVPGPVSAGKAAPSIKEVDKTSLDWKKKDKKS